MSVGGEGFLACENIALNQGRPTALDEVECHCNFCDSIMDRVVAGIEDMDDEGSGLEERCQQVGLDACFLHNPEQCLWAVDDLGFNELPTAEQCDAEGHSTARFDEPSKAQRAPLSFIGVVATLVPLLLFEGVYSSHLKCTGFYFRRDEVSFSLFDTH